MGTIDHFLAPFEVLTPTSILKYATSCCREQLEGGVMGSNADFIENLCRQPDSARVARFYEKSKKSKFSSLDPIFWDARLGIASCMQKTRIPSPLGATIFEVIISGGHLDHDGGHNFQRPRFGRRTVGAPRLLRVLK